MSVKVISYSNVHSIELTHLQIPEAESAIDPNPVLVKAITAWKGHKEGMLQILSVVDQAFLENLPLLKALEGRENAAVWIERFMEVLLPMTLGAQHHLHRLMSCYPEDKEVHQLGVVFHATRSQLAPYLNCVPPLSQSFVNRVLCLLDRSTLASAACVNRQWNQATLLLSFAN